MVLSANLHLTRALGKHLEYFVLYMEYTVSTDLFKNVESSLDMYELRQIQPHKLPIVYSIVMCRVIIGFGRKARVIRARETRL